MKTENKGKQNKNTASPNNTSSGKRSSSKSDEKGIQAKTSGGNSRGNKK